MISPQGPEGTLGQGGLMKHVSFPASEQVLVGDICINRQDQKVQWTQQTGKGSQFKVLVLNFYFTREEEYFKNASCAGLFPCTRK